MTLEKTLDAWLADRGRDHEKMTFEEKVKEMNNQWGHFARWHVSEMGKYYDIVITIAGGCLDDVQGLPEDWTYTLNDLDNEPE